MWVLGSRVWGLGVGVAAGGAVAADVVFSSVGGSRWVVPLVAYRVCDFYARVRAF